jgi:hypothetical protein
MNLGKHIFIDSWVTLTDKTNKDYITGKTKNADMI